jgi:hypothetical protein
MGLVINTTYMFGSPQFSPGQNPAGLWPAQVSHAYGFDQLKLDGTGETIAIVDAYGDPNLSSDLKTFDAQFKLPAPPTFTQESQTGGSDASVPTDSTGDWEVEEALDVEWAHAIAPGANILVVEANSATIDDLIAAVDQARNTAGVVAVTMSWGGNEQPDETNYDSHFTTPTGHGGITFLAASGDGGSPASYPALSPYVVGVGGTSPSLDANDNLVQESGWADSGGGYSSIYTVPSYQQSYASSSYVQNTLGNTVLLNGARGGPDVAFAASQVPGFAIYDSFPYFSNPLNWTSVGGTSAASPQWASLVALADQGRAGAGSLDGVTQTLPALYQLASSSSTYTNDFNDITTGNNGYSAQAGYDLVTGLGSPKANNLIPDLEKAGISTTLSVTTSTATPTAGSPFSVTVTAQNSSGQTLTSYAGTIHFTSSDTGKGVALPSDYTFQPGDNGTHTFTNLVTLVTAGSQTITATDTTTSAITGTAAVTVSPALASSLSVSAPASSYQNSPFSVTVTAKDAYGNTATGYGGIIQFISSDTGSGVVLPPNYAFQTSDKGSHTFTNGVTLVTLGNQTVTATDTNNSSVTGTATVNVTAPQSATHLSVSAPTSATAGSSFSVTVTALDANNNTATGYLGTVQFTTSDTGKGVILPSSYTFLPGDKGVHTFTNAFTLVTAPSQTVTATDTNTSSVTGSATVTINPSTAVSLSVAGFPSPISAGTSGNFTVTALDAYGNTATGYGGTVTFSSSDPNAQLPANSTLIKGVGTFSAVLQTTGTQSLTATDTVTQSITGSQTGITVTASTAPLPVILQLSPNTGTTFGGYNITIYGNNLTGTYQVFFGSTPGKVLGSYPHGVGVVVPAHAAGTVDVTVTTPAGTSTITSADQFTFTGTSPPIVTGVSPNSGSTAGGYTVTISGSNLAGATGVMFGNTPGQIATDTATSITVTAPAHTAGTVDVVVISSGGRSATSSADQFTFQSGSPPPSSGPTVTGLNPTSGPTAGGNMVTIAGTNLSGTMAVNFGTTSASILATSATSVVVSAPAHAAGVVDVTVITPGGTSATSAADQYTYTNAAPPSNGPTVLSVTPNSGPTAGGEYVGISGTNLSGVTAVRFGTTLARIMAVQSSSVMVLAPAHTAGIVDVTVVTPAGTSAITSADKFTYQSGSPPAPSARLAAVDALLAGGWSAKHASQLQIEYLIAEILTNGGGTQGIAPLTRKGK